MELSLKANFILRYSNQVIRLLLMDDNATCHRNSITNSFESQADIRTLKQPACSPDLNPNARSILKHQTRKHILPGDDLSRLEEILKQEWDAISQAKINRLIESMPSRIRNVIERSGDTTGYQSSVNDPSVLFRTTKALPGQYETKKSRINNYQTYIRYLVEVALFFDHQCSSLLD